MDETTTVRVTTSELAKAVISLKGKPLTMDDYIPMRDVYDCDPQFLTVKASRQIGKTLGVGAILTLKSIAIPHLTSIYIAPLSTQSSRFSTSYLDPFLMSPMVRKHFRDSSSKKNVFEKTLNNGSIIYLSYAETEADADRVRGIPGDVCYFDEVQDIQASTLPIVAEALSASPYGWVKHFGTAKTEQNTLETLFKKSNGLEWCVKCTHCGKWTIPWTFEDCLNICKGKDGPICVHCAKPIDMKTGRWVAAKPTVKNHYGFHVPRFIIPARITPFKWDEIHSKIETYKPSLLANEVFGLAAGVAGRILSQREAIACCNTGVEAFDNTWPVDQRGITSCVLGVDWSVTAGAASYTVITILGCDYMGKAYVLHSERLNGIDILDQVRRVEHLARQFKVQMVGSDRGVGQLQFELLKQTLGYHMVIPIQYCAAKTMLRYDQPGGYLAADRTMCMDMAILKMKMGKDRFETPSWNLMSTFWEDALNVYEEESHTGRKLYRKEETDCDDWLHSVVFAHIAWYCATGQYNLIDQLMEHPGSQYLEQSVDIYG